jgi:hypothetical protein
VLTTSVPDRVSAHPLIACCFGALRRAHETYSLMQCAQRQNGTRTRPRFAQASARDFGLRLHQFKRFNEFLQMIGMIGVIGPRPAHSYEGASPDLALADEVDSAQLDTIDRAAPVRLFLFYRGLPWLAAYR